MTKRHALSPVTSTALRGHGQHRSFLGHQTKNAFLFPLKLRTALDSLGLDRTTMTQSLHSPPLLTGSPEAVIANDVNDLSIDFFFPFPLSTQLIREESRDNFLVLLQ